MRVVTSALQAAETILTDWPIEESEILTAALLSCLEGNLSPGSARFAFIQAATKLETTSTSRNVDRRQPGLPLAQQQAAAQSVKGKEGAVLSRRTARRCVASISENFKDR
jgi:hypothetical protein